MEKGGLKACLSEAGLWEWVAPRGLDGHIKLYALKLGVYFHAINIWKGETSRENGGVGGP